MSTQFKYLVVNDETVIRKLVVLTLVRMDIYTGSASNIADAKHMLASKFSVLKTSAFNYLTKLTSVKQLHPLIVSVFKLLDTDNNDNKNTENLLANSPTIHQIRCRLSKLRHSKDDQAESETTLLKGVNPSKTTFLLRAK